MSRRIPMKIAPSPAGQRPENQAVENLVESSRAFQDKMRQTAGTHATPEAAPPETKAKREPQRQQKKAPEPAPKTPKSQTEPLQEDQAKTTEPTPVKISEQGGQGPRKRVETRLSISILLNQTMMLDAKKIADRLGKDSDYVIAALAKTAFDKMKEVAEDGNLAQLASDARLLADQKSDGGTTSQVIKRKVDVAWIKEARILINDPLNMLNDARVIAAFVGAALMAELKEA